MLSVPAQLVLWGVAAAAPVILSWVTRRLPVQVVATMLLGGWCVGRVLGAFLDPPESMMANPAIDLVFGVAIFMFWRKDREVWKLVIVGLLIGQCAAHAAFAMAYDPGLSPLAEWEVVTRYKAANNVLFALQLLTVTWAGGLDELVRRLRARLPGRARSGRHAGASR